MGSGRQSHLVAPASVPAKPDIAGTEACATDGGGDDALVWERSDVLHGFD